jgi:integrase
MEGVKEWLGHSSVLVTERAYAFLEIEHLHRAVQKSAQA